MSGDLSYEKSFLADGRADGAAPTFLSEGHDRPPVDDRCVLGRIIFFNRDDLRWYDAPRQYGRFKTPYNHWKRWSRLGIFTRIMTGLAVGVADENTIMIDATYLKVHRAASSLRVKKDGRGRLIGRTKGGMNTKLHAVADAQGHLICMFVTAGSVSDYSGAASLPKADWMLADRGYDADWCGDALKDKRINICISGRKSHKKPVRYHKRRYKLRNRIEIRFGGLKGWRRVATRHDKCPVIFLSAITLATTVVCKRFLDHTFQPLS